MAVIQGQAFELVVAVVLARSLGVSDEMGSVLGGRLGLHQAIETIKSLIDVPGYRLDAEAAKAWVQLAEKAAVARNRAIHSPWVAVAENDEHVTGLNATIGRGGFGDVTRRNPSSLDEDLALLELVLHQGASLAGILVDASAQNPAS
jgi:hypothetical protein